MKNCVITFPPFFVIFIGSKHLNETPERAESNHRFLEGIMVTLNSGAISFNEKRIHKHLPYYVQ
jgi:hypothetical protein